MDIISRKFENFGEDTYGDRTKCLNTECLALRTTRLWLEFRIGLGPWIGSGFRVTVVVWFRVLIIFVLF